jgi:hypothetical protein
MADADPGKRSPGAAAQAATRLTFGIEGGVAETVYGTVVAMATLTAAFATESHPAKLAFAVAATAVVLWLAHLHAHLLGESLATGRAISLPDVRRVARGQAGILLSAVPPTVALMLGATGVLREHTAVILAFTAGVSTLAVAGIRYSRLERLDTAGRLFVVAVNIGLGLLIVLLKAALSH